jgi:hypothetical protein
MRDGGGGRKAIEEVDQKAQPRRSFSFRPRHWRMDSLGRWFWSLRNNNTPRSGVVKLGENALENPMSLLERI